MKIFTLIIKYKITRFGNTITSFSNINILKCFYVFENI